jgi:LacI family transcriptional regulator
MIIRPTLADIAEAAGVSLMTVSRAINHKPGVSEKLRQRILSIAQEMGYRPNQIARGLATRLTTAVGLVVPDNTNPFFAQIARGVEDAAYAHHYNIFLVNTNEEPKRELDALDSLWAKEIDGVILCSSRLPVEGLEAQIQRFPAMVVVNRGKLTPRPNLTTVNVDDHRGAQLALQHLLAKGRQRIAYIAGPPASTSSQRRLEGYRSQTSALGLALDTGLIEPASPNTEGGRQAAAALLARRPDLDAIFAFNDLVAVGAVQVCQETGRRVPEDIAVIGVDDIPLATIFRPQLTTLHVDMAQIGNLCMSKLLDIINGESSPASIQVEPELYLRESA